MFTQVHTAVQWPLIWIYITGKKNMCVSSSLHHICRQSEVIFADPTVIKSLQYIESTYMDTCQAEPMSAPLYCKRYSLHISKR